MWLSTTPPSHNGVLQLPSHVVHTKAMVATIGCLRKGGGSMRPCTLQADGRTNWRCCHSYLGNLVTGPSGEGTASLYHPWFSCEYCTMQHESAGCQTSKGLQGPRCSRLTTPSAAQPERKGMPFCCGGKAAPAWGYFFTLTAKRLAVHVLSNGLGAPLYWFGSALLGSISLKTHSMFPRRCTLCVCVCRRFIVF